MTTYQIITWTFITLCAFCFGFVLGWFAHIDKMARRASSLRKASEQHANLIYDAQRFQGRGK